MRTKILENYENNHIRNDLPDIQAGQNIKVHIKIKEGSKQRIQVFEGLVIAIKHQGLSKTFTVRKMSGNVGVEKTFFYNSPLIQKIDIVRTNKVRRAKLYYMRSRKGKSARLKEIRK